MIDASEIRDSILTRLARQIEVEPLAFGRYPYRATLRLAPEATDVEVGHPWMIEVLADTPALAVDVLVPQLARWMHNPLHRALASDQFEDYELIVERRREIP